MGEDIVAFRGTEDRVRCGLRILATQFLSEVQADEEAGDEVVTGGGQAQAAALQLSDALQQATVEDLAHAAGDLFSKGPFKAGPEVLAPLTIQEKGETLWRGIRFQRLAES